MRNAKQNNAFTLYQCKTETQGSTDTNVLQDPAASSDTIRK